MGDDAPVFFAAATARPLTEGLNAGNQRLFGRFFCGILIPDHIRVVDSFHRFGNSDTTHSQQGGHDVGRVEQHIGCPLCIWAEELGKMQQKRYPNALLVGLLLVPPAVRTQQIAVVGGEDEDGVFLDPRVF